MDSIFTVVQTRCLPTGYSIESYKDDRIQKLHSMLDQPTSSEDLMKLLRTLGRHYRSLVFQSLYKVFLGCAEFYFDKKRNNFELSMLLRTLIWMLDEFFEYGVLNNICRWLFARLSPSSDSAVDSVELLLWRTCSRYEGYIVLPQQKHQFTNVGLKYAFLNVRNSQRSFEIAGQSGAMSKIAEFVGLDWCRWEDYHIDSLLNSFGYQGILQSILSFPFDNDSLKLFRLCLLTSRVLESSSSSSEFLELVGSILLEEYKSLSSPETGSRFMMLVCGMVKFGVLDLDWVLCVLLESSLNNSFSLDTLSRLVGAQKSEASFCMDVLSQMVPRVCFETIWRCIILLWPSLSGTITRSPPSGLLCRVFLQNNSWLLGHVDDFPEFAEVVSFYNLSVDMGSLSRKSMLDSITAWNVKAVALECKAALQEKTCRKRSKHLKFRDILSDRILKPLPGDESKSSVLASLLSLLGTSLSDKLLPSVASRFDQRLLSLQSQLDDPSNSSLTSILVQHKALSSSQSQLKGLLSDADISSLVIQRDISPAVLASFYGALTRLLSRMEAFLLGQAGHTAEQPSLSPRRTRRHSKAARPRSEVLTAAARANPLALGLLQQLLREILAALSACVGVLESIGDSVAEDPGFGALVKCVLRLCGSRCMYPCWPGAGEAALPVALDLVGALLEVESRRLEPKQFEDLVLECLRLVEQEDMPRELEMLVHQRFPTLSLAVPDVPRRVRLAPTDDVQSTEKKRRRRVEDTGSALGDIDPWEMLEGVPGNPVAQSILNESEYFSRAGVAL